MGKTLRVRICSYDGCTNNQAKKGGVCRHGALATQQIQEELELDTADRYTRESLIQELEDELSRRIVREALEDELSRRLALESFIPQSQGWHGSALWKRIALETVADFYCPK